MSMTFRVMFVHGNIWFVQLLTQNCDTHPLPPVSKLKFCLVSLKFSRKHCADV